MARGPTSPVSGSAAMVSGSLPTRQVVTMVWEIMAWHSGDLIGFGLKWGDQECDGEWHQFIPNIELGGTSRASRWTINQLACPGVSKA